MSRVVLWDTRIGDRPGQMAINNNLGATTNPGASNDSTQGYEVGSQWFNTSTKTAWVCVSAAAGAANWIEYGSSGTIVSDTSSAYNAANNAAGFQATGAQISGGSAFVELDLTGNPAGAANLQLPTVANLVAAIPGVAAGDSYTLRVKNSANSNTWTVTTATGWTLNGTMSIATGTWRDFVLTFTSLAAATLQNAGGGATL